MPQTFEASPYQVGDRLLIVHIPEGEVGSSVPKGRRYSPVNPHNHPIVRVTITHAYSNPATGHTPTDKRATYTVMAHDDNGRAYTCRQLGTRGMHQLHHPRSFGSTETWDRQFIEGVHYENILGDYDPYDPFSQRINVRKWIIDVEQQQLSNFTNLVAVLHTLDKSEQHEILSYINKMWPDEGLFLCDKPERHVQPIVPALENTHSHHLGYQYTKLGCIWCQAETDFFSQTSNISLDLRHGR